MKHIRQNGDANGGMVAGGSMLDGASVDDLDTLALSSDGLDPLEGTAIGPGGLVEDGVVGMGVSAPSGPGGAQGGGLSSMEPLDAFTMSERTMTPNDVFNSLSPNPAIPMAIGMPQAPPLDATQQFHAAMSASGMQQLQASSQAQLPIDCTDVAEMRSELQKKQILLQQVQQQKANLFGQSQKLQQQHMAASNPQQAQQLQKQQTILQQLNQQFEQQQSILQSEIQRNSILLQQAEMNQQQQPGLQAGNPMSEEAKGVSTNPTSPKAASAGAAAASSKASKNSNGKRKGGVGDESRPNKMAKVGSNKSGGAKSGKATEKPAKSNSGTTATATARNDKNLSSPGGMTKKSPSDGASTSSDKAPGASSLIPTMPVAAIEQHLDSLVSSGQLTPRYIARKCLPIVKRLINHDHGWVFKDPVDPVELGIPDYFDVVEHPMDLTLVVNKLEDGAYKDIASFERDTKLVFQNAILFNGDDSDVAGMAKELLDIFAADLKNAMKGEV